MRVLKKLKDKVTYLPVGFKKEDTLQLVSCYPKREKCIDSKPLLYQYTLIKHKSGISLKSIRVFPG